MDRDKYYNRVLSRRWGVSVVGKGLGFSQESPTIKTEWVDLVEGLKLEEKGKVGHRTRVGQSNLVAVGKLDEILSIGHCVTSVRGNI